MQHALALAWDGACLDQALMLGGVLTQLDMLLMMPAAGLPLATNVHGAWPR
jgi:hypothetical protein